MQCNFFYLSIVSIFDFVLFISSNFEAADLRSKTEAEELFLLSKSSSAREIQSLAIFSDSLNTFERLTASSNDLRASVI